MMLGLLLIVCLALGGVIAQSRCNCMIHPQTAYCDSDFVIRIKVTGVTNDTTSDHRHYLIRVLHWYQASEELRNLDTELLKVNYENRCGAELSLNQKYVVSGNVDYGKLEMGPCDWYQSVDEITPVQEIGLYKTYWANCKCSVFTVGDRMHCGSLKTASLFNSECYARHGICTKRRFVGFLYKCSWKIDRRQSACEMI